MTASNSHHSHRARLRPKNRIGDARANPIAAWVIHSRAVIVMVSTALIRRLTTQAQRPGAREAMIATATPPPGSLQRMVRPFLVPVHGEVPGGRVHQGVANGTSASPKSK